MRATDIPTYVYYGIADLGVTGRDIIAEKGLDVPALLAHVQGDPRNLRRTVGGFSGGEAIPAGDFWELEADVAVPAALGGELTGEVAEKLAQAKINIKYAYATTSEGSTRATVILAVPNVDKALGVIGG